MKLKNGQICAACVIYPELESYQWIVAKIEKKGVGKKYVVRDEYPDDPKYEIYTVESNRITPFPSSSTDYKPGDKILALWHDEETNQWSTMFYTATVVEKKSANKLVILYKGSVEPTIIDTNKVTKFPPGFDLQTESETEEPPKETENTEKADATTEANQDSTNSPKEKEEAEIQAKIHESQENRRINFMFNKPMQVEKTQIQCLKDEDFTELAGPKKEFKRMETQKGTPLLDSLEDPELFSQNYYTHITGSGRLSAPKSHLKGYSAFVNGTQGECGRLGMIFGEWSMLNK
ncbi:SGF29 tudor-like domain-containing protein [Histomonas meleagridis]|uniref:SGF29 tudor-like domain-containing protein n=1 Tax=Histomonas meleagridis TaxID=135588 RepID=UPI00355A065F|nr:SGF29 tudor-like domain-containing protein [Histomonas meleagridis]KAH0806509.1 SGF29 tudor-like domain-containing protein [Histomonas meleagridis]